MQCCTVAENPTAFLFPNAFIILKLLKPSLSVERKDYQVKFKDIKLGGRKKRDQFKEYMNIRNNKVHVWRLLLLTLANAHSFQGPVFSYGSTEHSAALPDHVLQLYLQAAF